MAKKKSSIEETIVTFFSTADAAAKQTLYNVITGLMKNSAPAATTNAAPTRAPRKAKAIETTPAATVEHQVHQHSELAAA